MISELAVLKFFPANNESVLLALVRLVSEMCHDEGEVRWLIDRMTSGLYGEWPGPAEMRACFCSRFRPRDGIEAYSTVYLDGIPSEKKSRLAIETKAPLALPEGHSATADSNIETAIRILFAASDQVSRDFSTPATPEEIRNAPSWLREMEGYL